MDDDEDDDSPKYEIVVRCQAVKKLSTALVEKLGGPRTLSVRVQGSLGGSTRETGGSTWGARGTPRSGDAVWSNTGTLTWGPFESPEELREFTQKRVLKLHCYASNAEEATLQNSQALGTLTLDVGRERVDAKPTTVWAKLTGPGAPAELMYSMAVRKRDIVSASKGGVMASPAKSLRSSYEEAPVDFSSLPAKRLGRGEQLFELCVSLQAAGDLDRLVGRELIEAAIREGGRNYWFSCEILGVVLQTAQFPSTKLNSPAYLAEADWFRLRCSATELAAELAKPIEVYLCTVGLVVALGVLNLEPLLPREAWPRDRDDGEFFSSEQKYRVRMDSRRALFSQPVEPGWLEVFSKLRRFGISDEEAAAKHGPRGFVPGMALQTTVPPPPPEEEEAEEEEEYEDESFDDDGVESPKKEDNGGDLPRRWRLHVELMHLSISSATASTRARLRYRAESLGQVKHQETSEFELRDDVPVGLRGGASSMLFARSENELRGLLEKQGAIVAELVDQLDDTVVMGAAEIDIDGLLNLVPARSNEDGSMKRSREDDYEVVMLEDYGHGAKLRARLTLEEFPGTDSTWGVAVASKLLEEEEEEEVIVARRRTDDPNKCPSCGTRVDEANARWEAWRAEEERAWASRLRIREKQRLAKLTAEAQAARVAERDETAAHRAEYSRLESRLRASLRDVEARERTLAEADGSLKRERQAKIAELQMLEKRLREESRHSVDAEKRRSTAIEKALREQRAATDRAEKRSAAAEADFDRWRAAHRRTPEAELLARVAKSRAESSELRARLERAMRETAEANGERERLRAHVHRLAKALQQSKDDAHDRARRDLDELRLEYRGREEKFVLDGDRRELTSIKDELSSIRNTAQTTKPIVVDKEEEHRNNAASSRMQPPSRQQQHTPWTLQTSYPSTAGGERPPTYAAPASSYGVDYSVDQLLPPPPTSRTAAQQPTASPLRASSFNDPPPTAAAASARSLRVDDEVLRMINADATYLGGAPAMPSRITPSRSATKERLIAEREVLVRDAGYPPDDPIVLEMDRLIDAADGPE